MDDALQLREALVQMITADKVRYERDMLEYTPLTTKAGVVQWKKHKRESKKRFKKESDSKCIIALGETVRELQQQLNEMKAKYEPKPAPELKPKPKLAELEINQDILGSILRHTILSGRDIVSALVCKQFRDVLRETASNWIHPKFYLQSHLFTIKFSCLPKCENIVSLNGLDHTVCAYTLNRTGSNKTCENCRMSKMAMYIYLLINILEFSNTLPHALFA